MTTKKIFSISLVSLICLFMFLGTTFAQQKPQQQSQRGGGGPPQEAIDACDGKNDGDSVTFVSLRGDSITGTCQDIQGQMVAVPENGFQKRDQGENDQQRGKQGKGRNGPPQEAIDACDGKDDGDTVTFETRDGKSVSGTCKDIYGQMVAVPENGRRGKGSRSQQEEQQQMR